MRTGYNARAVWRVRVDEARIRDGADCVFRGSRNIAAANAPIRIAKKIAHGCASSNPPIGSRPYRRARRTLSVSSRSDQGGSQRAFHSARRLSASASGIANPRTRRQHTRKVCKSPCCPAIAGGTADRYRRARSRASVVPLTRQFDGELGDVGHGGAIGVGKSAGVYVRSRQRYSTVTRCAGWYLWLKNPGSRVVCVQGVAA